MSWRKQELFTDRGKQKEELYESPLEGSAEQEGLEMPEATITLRQKGESKPWLQVSEELDLETFEKLRPDFIGAKTSTREGLAYKECSEVALPTAAAAGLDVTGKAVSFLRPKKFATCMPSL